MFSLAFLSIKLGVRGHGLRILLISAVMLLATVLLAGGFSGRQPLTVSVDVGLTGLRFILLLMVLLWMQDLLARDIERKNVYFVLAYPISRHSFLLSRFIAVALLSAGAICALGIALWLVLTLFGSVYTQITPPALSVNYGLTLFGLWLDVLVIAAFAILLASLSTTPFLPLILGFAFALAARGLGPTISHLRSDRADPDSQALLTPMLENAHLWLPDLSRLDWRPLTLYGITPDFIAMALAAVNALAYMGLMLALACWIFERRNFT